MSPTNKHPKSKTAASALNELFYLNTQTMWLLTYNGTTKSFAEWGLSNLRRSRVSQAQDTVSFSAPGPYDAAELFSYGATVAISFKNDSTGVVAPWFYGRVTAIPRAGAGDAESMDYELAGPWWFLDNLVYQQVWSAGARVHPYTLAADETKLGEETIGEPPDEIVYDLIGVYKSRVILGQDPAGAQRSSGEVITDVINYAIASGAPIQLDPDDPIEPDLEIPFDEQNDITCAEAIRRMLRWSPDAVTWFDYSTMPYPTFHCARRSALSALSVPIASLGNQQSSISNLSVTPRPDIQVPAVVLKFEQTNTIDGTEYESIVTDKFPLSATGREFAALTATLQLAGFQASYVTQKVVATLIPSEDAFWTAHDPTFLTTGTQVSAVVGVSQKSATPYDYELKEGQIQDWMTGKHAREVTYTAQVRTTTFDADLATKLKEEIRSVSCTIITTDASSGTYSQLASLVTGESIPVGLAKALYDSLNPLQYEGAVTLTEEECGLDSSVGGALRAATGFVLNLTNGLVAWETMNAIIQKVDEDVDSGRTIISFGPAEQLSPQDLVERLRANRGRGVAISYIKRTTGESSSGSATVALSGPTPLLNTAGAAGQTKLLVVTDNTDKISIDPAQIAALTSAVHELKIKKVSVCDSETGTVRYMLTIASEVFDE